MADIIEAFVVSIGLDPTNHKKQIADFKSDLKGAREEAHSTALAVESDNKRMIDSFSRLRNEVVGLALVAAGASGVRGLLGDMVHGAAETGRLATNLGMATEQVSAWEGAVRSMGGTAQDAQTALRAFNTEYQTYLLTGHTAHDADYAALGIGPNDLRSPMSLISALAGRSEQMDRTQFVARAERLGIPDSVINTLARGRRGVQDLIEEQYRLGVVTRADAQAAIEFERQWANLTTQLRSELRPVLTWLVEQALPWIRDNGPAVAQALGVGIAGGVVLMTAAMVRAAGPMGILIAGLTTIIGLAQQIGSWDRAGAGWHDMYLRVRESALRGQLDAIPNDTRENMARRAEVLEQIADVQGMRLEMSRRVHGDGATAAPTTGGTRWQSGLDYGPGGGGGAGGVLSRIRQTESGGNYNRVVYDAFRNVNLTGMSMGAVNDWQRQVLRPRTRGRGTTERQRRLGSTGVGAYQFESGTLEQMAREEFGANWRSVPFSPANQDRLARRLHSQYGTSPWGVGGTGGRHVRGGAQLAQRGGGRSGAGGGSVSVGTIVVNVPHGTPQAQAERVAREVPRAVARRGVVTQANTGLK